MNVNFTKSIPLHKICFLLCFGFSFPLFAQPQFDSCNDIAFCGRQVDCSAKTILSNTISGNCNPSETLTIGFKIDLDNDGNYDYLGSNITPYPFPNPNGLPIIPLDYSDVDNDGVFDLLIDSLEYPVGSHRILWTAEDVCANSIGCEYVLEAEDCTLPTAIPIFGLTIDIVDIDSLNCQVELNAAMLDGGSFDNCCLAANSFRIAYPAGGPNQTIPPTATKYTFDMQHLGTRSIDFWVQDCHGNWNYELTYVNIQNGTFGCEHIPVSGYGTIKTAYEDPVAGVEVSLEGNASNLPLVEITGMDGQYIFHNLEYEPNYTIRPEKDVADRNGVSILDIIMISRHLIGLDPLDSPFRLIAADVDNDENISTFDLIDLQRLILFIDDKFTSNSSWRFVAADYTFDEPMNPWASPFPEIGIINPANGSKEANFIAIKIGDVSGNAKTDLKGNANDRSFHGNLHFQTKDILLNAEEEYLLNFKAIPERVGQGFLGYQYTLDFDPEALEIIEVKSNDLEAQFGWKKEDEGILTSTWTSADPVKLEEKEVLFSLKIKAKSTIALSKVLRLNSNYTAAEAYNDQLELINLDLKFTTSDFALYQNEPNPFREKTSIGFVLPQAGEATLRIFDSSGKLLKLITGDYDKGYQEIIINREEWLSNGVFYYQLQSVTASQTRKMILF